MSDPRVTPGQVNVTNLQKHIARYNWTLDKIRNARVLDAGCGTGYGSFIMSWSAEKVHGIDIDKPAILYATNVFKWEKTIFYTSDICKWEKPTTYGAIIAFEVIEHLEDYNLFFDKVDKNLASGGTFIFSIPVNEKEGDNTHHIHTFDLTKAIDLHKKKNYIYNYFHQINLNINSGFDPSFYTGQRGYFICQAIKL